MNDALYIAATGMQMQQKSVDTIANNLANVNTPGFKKGRVTFEDMVYREISRLGTGTEAPASLWHGGGVNVAAMAKVFTAGELRKTDAQLDLAIQGDGFLEVVMADGSSAYSRGGTLSVDRDGFLATADGHALKPAIHVGTDAKLISIKADGQVLVQGENESELRDVGRIEMSHFSDNSGLVSLGANLYLPSAKSGDAIYGKPGDNSAGTLAQGYVEASNVNLVNEMVDLMAAQRAYESSVKVIQASDEMLALSNNLRK
ncbi:flagellar basal-body rod protein FlgG [Duganella sp. FT80W]|uniref:Flagellar basal-body rod protein FlgG n=1 Tax=Duganella guangzhouensis TaxID=2666084 RepID=A0A6I2LBH7_9BURK|nr:flagellar basal-body rod protein FlgG [Duganella guangzhouensis]MRW94164.1 flagellar basal-body rod protein FlgG [Duganella guangzhouensis]